MTQSLLELHKLIIANISLIHLQKLIDELTKLTSKLYKFAHLNLANGLCKVITLNK